MQRVNMKWMLHFKVLKIFYVYVFTKRYLEHFQILINSKM